MNDANIYILHIETSTKICSVALSRGKEIVDFLDLAEGMNHAALLAPSIDRLLQSTTLHPGELSAISISAGPGSYTGLRVGSSTAKAMAYALKIPLLPIPTLYALAHAALKLYPQATMVMPMLDARRNEVFTALYDKDMKEIIPVSSMILEKEVLSNLLSRDQLLVFCGDGSGKLEETMIPSNSVIDRSILSSAVHLAEPAFEMFLGHRYSDVMHFVPFYLKPPNITKPRVAG
jgi:tRNA threonylcarbamoyladenosine biosynthesis protein TsaB